MTTARALMRLSLVSLALLTACGKPVGGGAIELVIELKPGVTSQCVKAFATDGTNTLPSELIVLRGKTSPLRVGVFEATLSSPVTLWAQGYSDTGCTVETAGEVSERVMASFSNPPAMVTVTLAPLQQSGLDGGADAGLPDAGLPDAGTVDSGVDAGVDAGADAGTDQDMDGFPAGVDCNDTNAAVYPGAPELCGDGLDNNCNGTIDCFDLLNCDGQLCTGGGRCSSMTCMQPHETVCNDGLDNDMDLLVDCLDPDCAAGSTCNDSNACTTGERCVADAGCEKTGDVACNSPPAAQCWVAAGVCQLDGGQCAYTPMAGNCNDNLACTTGDTCANGTCAGTAVTCAAPPVCRGAGTCQESAGACVFPALAQGTGTCSDGNNCTINDSCDGDGGCAGTTVTCTPTQCQQANGCAAGGTCQFLARTGQPCDAGTGAPATCNAAENCVVTPTTVFPYTTSNFIDSQLAKPDGGALLNINCDVTINTSGTPAVTGACFGTQAISLITPTGTNALQSVLIQLNSLNVNAGRTITVTGNRPLILAVVGNAQIDGTILANNSGGTSGDCGNGGTAGTRGGGGGGGFGGAGAAGGDANTGAVTGGSGGPPNGIASLAPLRGGCDGSAGITGGAGGVGGGALQLSASGTVTIGGSLNVPGKGGVGATATANVGNGGGGGGSGGGLLLEGVTVSVSGVVTANGGGGGKGSRGSSGSAGLDGEQTLNGGQGGTTGSTGAGNGGRGGGRAAVPVAGSPGNDATAGGGGGGGGVGRVRLNAMTGCSISVTATVSPAATSNGAAGCP
jgi:hypothetical protein